MGNIPKIIVKNVVRDPSTVFPVYSVLFFQIPSDSFQNVPFCSVDRVLPGHTLLVPGRTTPPHSYFQPFPLPPFHLSLVTTKKKHNLSKSEQNWFFFGFSPQFGFSKDYDELLLFPDSLVIFSCGTLCMSSSSTIVVIDV